MKHAIAFVVFVAASGGAVAASAAAQSGADWIALQTRPLTSAERAGLERALAALPYGATLDRSTISGDASRPRNGKGGWRLAAELSSFPRQEGRICWVRHVTLVDPAGPAGWAVEGGPRHWVWRDRGDRCRLWEDRVSVGEQVDPRIVGRLMRDWERLLARAVPVIRGITACSTKRLGDLRLASIAQTGRRDRVELGFQLPPGVAGEGGYGKTVFVTYRIRGSDYTPWTADCAA